MYVVQLAVEGLAGFAERTQFGFRGQLDVVRLPSVEARTAFVDVLFHTLFPDPDRADATAAWADPSAPKRRAVLTVAGKDKVPYRLMRGLEDGRARLYRFDRARGSHTLLSESGAEAQQFLRVQQQLPDDTSFERLFLIGPDTRASAGPEARSRCGAIRTGMGVVAASGPGLGAGAGLLGGAGLQAGAPRGGGFAEPAAGELTGMFPIPSVLAEGGGGPATSAFALHNVLAQQELEVSGTIDMVTETPDEELLRRHREVSRELGRIRRATRVERSLDELSEKETAARKALDAYEAAQQRYEEVRRGVRQLESALEVPVDFEERLDRFERLEAHQRAEREALGRELEAAEAARDQPVSAPTAERWLRLAGIGGAVVSGGLALVLREPSLLLAQVGLGSGAAALAWRDTERTRASLARASVVAEVQERIEASERNHHIETSTVRATLARLGTDSVAEVRRHLAELTDARAHLDAAQAELDGEVGRRGQRAQEILHRIQDKREKLEAKLREAGGAPSLVGPSLERRLKGLEAELSARGLSIPDEADAAPAAPARPRSPAADTGDAYLDAHTEPDPDPGQGGRKAAPSDAGAGWWCIGGGVGGGGLGASAGGYGGGGPDPAARTRMLVDTAADLSGRDEEQLFEEAKDRVGRYVRALSGNRFAAARPGPRGGLQVQSREGWVAAESLSGDLLDQVDAGLRLGLLETVLRVRRVPVIVEEPFAAFPPERRGVVRRVYAHLASFAQVIVVTAADDVGGRPVQVR